MENFFCVPNIHTYRQYIETYHPLCWRHCWHCRHHQQLESCSRKWKEAQQKQKYWHLFERLPYIDSRFPHKICFRFVTKNNKCYNPLGVDIGGGCSEVCCKGRMCNFDYYAGILQQMDVIYFGIRHKKK